MFKRLLVPLDGSPLAEAAIPAAVLLAKQGGAAVALLHIIEKDAPATVHGDRHLTSAAEANAYLSATAARLFPQGVRASCHVHELETKNVAAGIADHLLELHQDTVVMAAHGHGGLRDVLFGNIAQQVVARGTMPVLLIRGHTPFACRRILIPHDGVPEHEPALQVGIELACRTSAEVKLVMVVPTAGTLAGAQAAVGQMLPRATRILLELAEQEGIEHLQSHAAELRGRGLQAGTEVRRGDPAAEIVKAGQAFRADVTVLGTHGKSGAQAFWDGSVAARVAAKSALPLLFVPISKIPGGSP